MENQMERATATPATGRVTIWRVEKAYDRRRQVAKYRLAPIQANAHERSRLFFVDRHPDCFCDGGRTPRESGTWYADVPIGMLIITVAKDESSFGKRVSYSAGRVALADNGEAIIDKKGVRHRGVSRQGGSYVHAIEIDGARHEFKS